MVTLNRVTQWSLEIVTNLVPLNSYNYSRLTLNSSIILILNTYHKFYEYGNFEQDITIMVT